MRKAWTLQVTVSQNSDEVLDLFDIRFPGATWHRFARVTNLTWYGSHGFKLIETLAPLLVVKKQQALAVLPYIELSRNHIHGKAWTIAEREQIDEIALRVKAFKDPQERGR